MTTEDPNLSLFFDPALCANNGTRTDGSTYVCHKQATSTCAGCHLVQYCSKDCQVADWKSHKPSCKSPLMKTSWKPEWAYANRKPAFICGNSDPLYQSFGGLKFLWGNMPAFDVLNINQNEGEAITDGQDISVLFAASGDLRNVVKSVAGLPETFRGKCRIVINDRELTVVVRNIMMLLIALHFDVEMAVPMIIHIWYSAAMPHTMVDALQSELSGPIEDVCNKIKHKPATSLQSKTFLINQRELRVVLTTEAWFQLKQFFFVPDGLSLEKSQEIRRRVTLAPERIDYRERAMLHMSGPLREMNTKFRRDGILLPFACSRREFDTPNPTLFQGNCWSMQDSSSPCAGWNRAEYLKHTLVGYKDEHGALFFSIRDLLVRFCARVRSQPISFTTFHTTAQRLGTLLGNMKFDRIEMANICDRGYVGPQICIQTFEPLLKEKSVNCKATIIMLFINGAVEEMNHEQLSHRNQSDLKNAMKSLNKYLPLEPATISRFMQPGFTADRDPEFLYRTACHDLLRDWDMWFDSFLKNSKLIECATSAGLKVKPKNTIVRAWPSKAGVRVTEKEFHEMRAGELTGCARYVEIQRS